MAQPSITKVESLFPVEWRPWVSVRNSLSSSTKTNQAGCKTYHLAVAESVQHTSSVKPDVMENSTLSWVECHSKPPFLPFHQVSIGHIKARSIRLDDIQFRKILSCASWKKFRNIFGRLAVINNA